jgi:hypothetical protein
MRRLSPLLVRFPVAVTAILCRWVRRWIDEASRLRRHIRRQKVAPMRVSIVVCPGDLIVVPLARCRLIVTLTACLNPRRSTQQYSRNHTEQKCAREKHGDSPPSRRAKSVGNRTHEISLGRHSGTSIVAGLYSGRTGQRARPVSKIALVNRYSVTPSEASRLCAAPYDLQSQLSKGYYFFLDRSSNHTLSFSSRLRDLLRYFEDKRLT